jgi:hypothetical protein
MSIASASLRLAGLYESELLVELMLRYWQHPFADDPEYRNSLLEAAVDALKGAASGQRLFDDIPPGRTNLVAAICYAELITIAGESFGPDQTSCALRRDWVEKVKRALPSCFCDPDLLS